MDVKTRADSPTIDATLCFCCPQIAESVASITNQCIAHCKEFDVERICSTGPGLGGLSSGLGGVYGSASNLAALAAGGGSAATTPHADASSAAADALRPSASAANLLPGPSGSTGLTPSAAQLPRLPGAAGGRMQTLMYFRGCRKPLCGTVLLRGGTAEELTKVKRVITFLTYAAHRSRMETGYLGGALASAASAVAPNPGLVDPAHVGAVYLGATTVSAADNALASGGALGSAAVDQGQLQQGPGSEQVAQVAQDVQQVGAAAGLQQGTGDAARAPPRAAHTRTQTRESSVSSL